MQSEEKVLCRASEALHGRGTPILLTLLLTVNTKVLTTKTLV